MAEEDYRCKERRVMGTDEWKAQHNSHGIASKVLNEHQPPKGTYEIYTLICLCGARHVFIEEQIEAAAREK